MGLIVGIRYESRAIAAAQSAACQCAPPVVERLMYLALPPVMYPGPEGVQPVFFGVGKCGEMPMSEGPLDIPGNQLYKGLYFRGPSPPPTLPPLSIFCAGVHRAQAPLL